jgi:hypothetical protein
VKHSGVTALLDEIQLAAAPAARGPCSWGTPGDPQDASATEAKVREVLQKQFEPRSGLWPTTCEPVQSRARMLLGPTVEVA